MKEDFLLFLNLKCSHPFSLLLYFFCTGVTVVEWLISKGKARNRPEALMLATGLLNEGFLQPADDLSKEGAEGGEQTAFLDQTKALYYFVSSALQKLLSKMCLYSIKINYLCIYCFLKVFIHRKVCILSFHNYKLKIIDLI